MIRALLVDDHPVSLEFLRAALMCEGVEPTLVSSGPEALIAHERQNFDLLLIDWLMPGISGVEVVRRVRASSSLCQPHIIMLTAKTSDDDLVEAFAAGVDDFIRKPISVPELKARLTAGLRILAARRNLTDRLEEIRTLHAKLEAGILTDAVTELPNRAGMIRKCDALLGADPATLRPATRHALTAAVVDIDDFRNINCVLGEPKGDDVLRFVARTIRAHVRKEDEVGRIGADEFLVLFPGADPVEAAAIVDLCARRLIENAPGAPPHGVHITFCAGIAAAGPGISGTSDLLLALHERLSDARRRGGGQIASTDELPAMSHPSRASCAHAPEPARLDLSSTTRAGSSRASRLLR